MQAPQKIHFLIYDQIEVLDFTGPFDVFSMANVMAVQAKQPEPFELITVAPTTDAITAIHGLSINPTYGFDTVPAGSIDFLIIPGCAIPTIKNIEEASPGLVKWVSDLKGQCKIMATVCVGAIIGAEAGLFDSKKVTTHHGLIDTLEEKLKGKATVIPGARYVDNPPTPAPHIVSSAGVSAGIDMAFYMLNQLVGPELTKRTMNVMEYNGTTNFMFGK